MSEQKIDFYDALRNFDSKLSNLFIFKSLFYFQKVYKILSLFTDDYFILLFQVLYIS